MLILGKLLLFFLAGFASFLVNADRRSGLGVFLIISLPVAGVYLFGWWALAIFVAGLFFGGKMFWSGNVSKRDNLDH